jgi:hypothetical protein
MEVSHNDAPNSDMTHQAPTSPVRSPGHGFHQGAHLHAKAGLEPRGSRRGRDTVAAGAP